MSWGLKFGTKLEPVAFRRRREAQIFAGRRWMPAGEYMRAAGRDDANEYNGVGNASAVWKAVLRRHPEARLVRVSVRLGVGK